MKYCNTSGVITWSGGQMVLNEGMTADDDHPLVKERPDLWSDQQPGASLSAPPQAPDAPAPGEQPKIERATKAPGEKRGGTTRG